MVIGEGLGVQELADGSGCTGAEGKESVLSAWITPKCHFSL